jgi:hypothetical protein
MVAYLAVFGTKVSRNHFFQRFCLPEFNQHLGFGHARRQAFHFQRLNYAFSAKKSWAKPNT